MSLLSRIFGKKSEVYQKCPTDCSARHSSGEDENRKSSPAPSRRLWKAFIINDIF